MNQKFCGLSYKIGLIIILGMTGIVNSLFLLSSCQRKEHCQPSLVGRWEMLGNNSDDRLLTLCMYEDSTFTMSASNAVPQSGKWVVSKDTLKCSGNRNDYSGRTHDYYELVFKIVRHNEKELFLGDFESLQVMEFNRIHE